jgi:hypothetical protein
MAGVTHELAWRRLDAPGLELCRASLGAAAAGEATGVLLAREDGAWFALRWRVAWDAAWRTRRVEVERLDGAGRLGLGADGEGRWSADGAVRTDLDGCVDVDLAATPFTNTLPIRRLSLAAGAAASLRVAYLDLPALSLRPLVQRYTCLARSADGARWRYEDELGNRIDGIATDADGLVAAYPGLFERVAA